MPIHIKGSGGKKVIQELIDLVLNENFTVTKGDDGNWYINITLSKKIKEVYAYSFGFRHYVTSGSFSLYIAGPVPVSGKPTDYLYYGMDDDYSPSGRRSEQPTLNGNIFTLKLPFYGDPTILSGYQAYIQYVA